MFTVPSPYTAAQRSNYMYVPLRSINGAFICRQFCPAEIEFHNSIIHPVTGKQPVNKFTIYVWARTQNWLRWYERDWSQSSFRCRRWSWRAWWEQSCVCLMEVWVASPRRTTSSRQRPDCWGSADHAAIRYVKIRPSDSEPPWRHHPSRCNTTACTSIKLHATVHSSHASITRWKLSHGMYVYVHCDCVFNFLYNYRAQTSTRPPFWILSKVTLDKILKITLVA